MDGAGRWRDGRTWTLAAAIGRFLLTVVIAVTFAFLMESATPRPGAGAQGPLERYASYWLGLLDPSITARVTRALPWTLAIMGTATLIAVVVGTLVGAWLGRPDQRRPGWGMVLVGVPVVVMASVPPFLTGIGLIALFTHELKLLPPALPFTATQTWNDDLAAAVDLLRHAVLPVATIALAGIGASALTMRALMIQTTHEDHARYAESLGLHPRRLRLAHGMRPALAPQATALGLGLGLAVSGAILVEALFSYPGLGWMLWRAVQQTDLPMIRTITLLLIVGLALVMLVLDLLLPWLDPRIRR